MRVFVTGASGHIASALIPELVQAGHEVVGLARSDASAAVVQALGAEVLRGDLDDLDGLRKGAADADAVVHLGFKHDAIASGRFADAVADDLAVVRAFGDALAGTGKALIGIGLTPTGNPQRDAAIHANPRTAVAREIAGLTEHGVRTVLIAVPPVTHSPRDRSGFIPKLIGIARATGVSGYVGDGANRWPAGHALDVGRLFRLAVEKAPVGSQLHAATEEGVLVRDIAETIGRHLGVPAVSIPAEKAAEHFTGFPFAALDITMSNAATRQLLGWEPVHPGLIADLDNGHYFAGN
ncbi:SDR family oxidoreductase [Streptomyces sp. CoH27]|uniref:SDR family oxidoreductase n=1 Tax=Streptomyces sp. CoH27 TaxID=2875763 RepID=UPI001CD41787|nr:SDR family oxidoreductase [Streptomyces sp. CoH27]